MIVWCSFSNYRYACTQWLPIYCFLVGMVWRDSKVFAAWRDALVVSVPKKGDLNICDNWGGIGLLDVAGKLLCRIVQEHLQSIAQLVLPDSQCEFQQGGVVLIWFLLQGTFFEKVREHNWLLFTLFVDLRKAYDSVPWDALWLVLERCPYFVVCHSFIS